MIAIVLICLLKIFINLLLIWFGYVILPISGLQTGFIIYVQSFSAKGHPYDNAVMECFFKYMKKEETDRRNYQSSGEVKQSLFTVYFIDIDPQRVQVKFLHNNKTRITF